MRCGRNRGGGGEVGGRADRTGGSVSGHGRSAKDKGGGQNERSQSKSRVGAGAGKRGEATVHRSHASDEECEIRGSCTMDVSTRVTSHRGRCGRAQAVVCQVWVGARPMVMRSTWAGASDGEQSRVGFLASAGVIRRVVPAPHTSVLVMMSWRVDGVSLDELLG